MRCFLGALLRDVVVAGTWGLGGGTGGTPQCCEHCVVRVGNVTKGEPAGGILQLASGCTPLILGMRGGAEALMRWETAAQIAGVPLRDRPSTWDRYHGTGQRWGYWTGQCE